MTTSAPVIKIPGWAEIPTGEVARELAYWRQQRVDTIWLVPCYYTDGSPTVSGQRGYPNNSSARRYSLGYQHDVGNF